MEEPSKVSRKVTGEDKFETKKISTDSDEKLNELSRAIKTIEEHATCAHDSAFELQKEGLKGEYDRQARVLRFIAAMLHHEMKEIANDPYHNLVVAVALLKYQGEWRFIVAANGHKDLKRKKRISEAIPESIGGIPVDYLIDDADWRLPRLVADKDIALQSDLKAVKAQRGTKTKSKTYKLKDKDEVRKVPELTAESVWQWHSEQKLLRYVKAAYGSAARQSIVALGVSQVPCTEENMASNHCREYLERKYLRALSSDKDNCVAAYWYQRTAAKQVLSPPCDKKSVQHLFELRYGS